MPLSPYETLNNDAADVTDISNNDASTHNHASDLGNNSSFIDGTNDGVTNNDDTNDNIVSDNNDNDDYWILLFCHYLHLFDLNVFV